VQSRTEKALFQLLSHCPLSWEQGASYPLPTGSYDWISFAFHRKKPTGHPLPANQLIQRPTSPRPQPALQLQGSTCWLVCHTCELGIWPKLWLVTPSGGRRYHINAVGLRGSWLNGILMDGLISSVSSRLHRFLLVYIVMHIY
jgi:hypothetical protein